MEEFDGEKNIFSDVYIDDFYSICLPNFFLNILERLKNEIPESWGEMEEVSIFEVKAIGEVFIKKKNIVNGIFNINLDVGKPYLVKTKK